MAAFSVSVSGRVVTPASASCLRSRSIASSKDDFSRVSSDISVRDYGPKFGVEAGSSPRLRRLPAEPARGREGRLLRRDDGADAGAAVREPQKRGEGGARGAAVRRAPGATPLSPSESDDVPGGGTNGGAAGR